MSVRAVHFHLNAVSLETNLAEALGQCSKARKKQTVILQIPLAHEQADISFCACVCMCVWGVKKERMLLDDFFEKEMWQFKWDRFGVYVLPSEWSVNMNFLMWEIKEINQWMNKHGRWVSLSYCSSKILTWLKLWDNIMLT